MVFQVGWQIINAIWLLFALTSKHRTQM